MWLLTGIATEFLIVLWNVSLARFIRPDRLARVSAYDGLGSTIATPLGALAADWEDVQAEQSYALARD